MRAADVYRALLWCYPAQFRQEYGREMVSAFNAQITGGRRDAVWLGTATIWVLTLFELLPTAFREHRHVMLQDLRQAIRLLSASPAFTVVAVLSLALGIGANAAIFSLLNSVMLSTLPVGDPHDLVMLTDPGSSGVAIGQQRGERSLVTYPEFRLLQDPSTTFASVMASSSGLQRAPARIAGDEPEEISIRLVSASYFPTLGVPAHVGRTFDGRQEPAEGSAPYAVISYEYWQRRSAAHLRLGPAPPEALRWP